MSKITVALLAISVSILAAACGGGAEPAKAPEGAASAAPEAAPSAAPSAAPDAPPPAK
jgi:hypothetical protein